MNNTIKTQLNHKTIRNYSREKISEEDVQMLFDVAIQTSTSMGMQQASIIRVIDGEKRKKLQEVTGQKYIIDASEVLIFIVDNYRNYRILEEKQAQENYSNDIDRFFQGFTDGALMAQNVAVAAESMGIGICFFGSILNDARRVIEILDLPENTFPIVGLGIGYPSLEPQFKPRMDKGLRIFEDSYEKYNSYLKEFKKYDEEMTQYYDTRDNNKRSDSFTKQVYDKNTKQVLKRSDLLEMIREQGFNI